MKTSKESFLKELSKGCGISSWFLSVIVMIGVLAGCDENKVKNYVGTYLFTDMSGIAWQLDIEKDNQAYIFQSNGDVSYPAAWEKVVESEGTKEKEEISYVKLTFTQSIPNVDFQSATPSQSQVYYLKDGSLYENESDMNGNIKGLKTQKTKSYSPAQQTDEVLTDENGLECRLDENGNPYYLDQSGNVCYKDQNGNFYYLDQNGNAYYLDQNGNAYYLDQNGNAYYLDQNGNAYYLDQNGNAYYLDQNGNAYYLDQDGNAYYLDENGNAYYLDQNGNAYYLDQNGNAYYLDQNGNAVYYN